MAEQDSENLIPNDAGSAGPPPLPEPHHARDHAHHDDAPLADELDPANRSLAEALRLSFMFLKLIIVLLVILFFGSAWYKVDDGTVVVCLRLGKVLGEPGQQVRRATGRPYFAWPEPIDRQIIIPTTLRTVPVLKAFWYQVRPGDETKPLDQQAALSSGSIPGRDGSLITADKNLVHGQWMIDYKIEPDNAVKFVQNVGLTDPGKDVLPLEYANASAAEKSMYRADRLVASAAERGLIHAVAQSTVDQFIQHEVEYNRTAKPVIQELLDTLGSGITITNVAVNQTTPPIAVRRDFQQVNEALAEKANKIKQAEKEQSRILRSVAGANYAQLLETIGRYEEARALGQDSADAEQQVVELLQSDRIRGRAKDIIREAISYRTQVVQDIKGRAENFALLLPRYRKDPRIFRNRLWQDARREILSSDNETFYLAPGQTSVYLELSRDPIIERNREMRKNIQEQEADRAAKAAAASLMPPPPDMPGR